LAKSSPCSVNLALSRKLPLFCASSLRCRDFLKSPLASKRGQKVVVESAKAKENEKKKQKNKKKMS
jgi:hypothetical protein